MGQKNPARMARWLEKLVRSEDGKLRAAQRRRARSAADADDIVQEMYYRMLRRKDDPELIQKPLAYLHSVAGQIRNERAGDVAADIVRYDSSMVEKATEGAEERQSAEDPAEVYLRAAEVHDRLARLNWAHRTVFVLLERYGYTYAEVAVWLDIDISKVKRYLIESNKKMTDLAPRRPKPRALLGEPGKG